MDTRMYVMTHKKIAELPDPFYQILHVGREGKEDLGYPGDHTGDNISGKNSSYCELTGIYWLWKNVTCDVIGICHYRRYFVREDKLLGRDYIEHMIEEYPILAPRIGCVQETNIYEQYASVHCAADLDACRTVIAEQCAEYLDAYDFAMRSAFLWIGNMWITRKDIFDRYCSWLFPILFEVEKRIDTASYDSYQTRVIGFLAERLFRVWMLLQPEAVREEEVKNIEPEYLAVADAKNALLTRFVRVKLDPLLRLYRAGIACGSLARPLACADDFDGKIPVWMCWWQGEEEMPELIRGCISRLRENLPADKTAFRLITLENFMEYVTFTEAVLRRFHEGKITYTHLSDLLRAELLFRYGGMWADASYYTSGPIPEDIFNLPLYTLRFETSVWNGDMTKGQWSSNLWHAKKGEKLFAFLMEGLWYYFETEERLIDYFLMDYIIGLAVEEFPDIRERLAQCPYSANTVHALSKMLYRKYTPQRVEQLLSESLFSKLNWRLPYEPATIAGEMTVYGYLFQKDRENR